MCDHQPREAAMVVTNRDQDGTPTVWCDPCLEPLVRALNDGGLPTIASCCGHGLLPGNVILKDGRCLLLLPSYEDAAWMQEHWLDVGPGVDYVRIDAAVFRRRLMGCMKSDAEDDSYEEGWNDALRLVLEVFGESAPVEELWSHGEVAPKVWDAYERGYQDGLVVEPPTKEGRTDDE